MRDCFKDTLQFEIDKNIYSHSLTISGCVYTRVGA